MLVRRKGFFQLGFDYKFFIFEMVFSTEILSIKMKNLFVFLFKSLNLNFSPIVCSTALSLLLFYEIELESYTVI